MSAAIEFEFKGNLAQLRRDLNEASRLARASANETSRATTGGVAGLFRRTPERRAERAFAGLGTALASGDVTQGLAVFSEKLSGLGLAAGIGVGVAVGLFEKFRSAIKEADTAFSNLEERLNRPLKIQLGLGPQALTAELEANTKAIDTAIEKSSSKWVKFLDLLSGRSTDRPILTKSGLLEPPKDSTAENREKKLAELEEVQNKLAGERADKELKIANLKLQSVTGSEKEAALAKITLDAEEKRAALLLSRKGNALDLFKSNLAIDVEAQAARVGIEKKFPEFHVPETSANMDFFNSPIPGGRTAGPGESQYLVNQIEANRLRSERSNAGLPPAMSAFQDIAPQGFFGDYLNDPQGAIDRAFFSGPRSYPGSSGASGMDEIGTGIDGIKSGVDRLNDKMDKYFA